MVAAFGMRITEVIHVVELTYPCLTAPRVVLCCVGMYNIECCVRILLSSVVYYLMKKGSSAHAVTLFRDFITDSY